MNSAELELADLQVINPKTRLIVEGGNTLAYMEDAVFKAGGERRKMALLLYPSAHSGYVTRLFFQEKLEGCGSSKNWTEHTVAGRRWWAPSWQSVGAAQSWTSMLTAHLRAVT
jgi:hypothetical protein